MDERGDMDKSEEVLLPGFRFHPTDEELVGFYLKRKIQQKPLSIELIRQLDIYKYDPWDRSETTRKFHTAVHRHQLALRSSTCSTAGCAPTNGVNQLPMRRAVFIGHFSN